LPQLSISDILLSILRMSILRRIRREAPTRLNPARP
jgi:hypothetical protein